MPHPEHRPRRNSQLSTGMFSSAVIWWPQDGQCERGLTRLNGETSGGGSPRTSAACWFHSFSIILGTRRMTTFRKLPTARPSASASPTASAGDCASSEMKSILAATRGCDGP